MRCGPILKEGLRCLYGAPLGKGPRRRRDRAQVLGYRAHIRFKNTLSAALDVDAAAAIITSFLPSRRPKNYAQPFSNIICITCIAGARAGALVNDGRS